MRNFSTFIIVFFLTQLPACSNGENNGVSIEAANPGRLAFEDGHDTDQQDHGRPVVLIGNALGVTPEIFRDAFIGVTPARNGAPSPSHAQANKKILMDALGKHGVSNERLDEVSNFYRYRPQSEELWKHRPAIASAIIENGNVVGFNIEDSGFGYSTPPSVQIAGFAEVKVKAEIEFTTDLNTNGRLSALSIVEE